MELELETRFVGQVSVVTVRADRLDTRVERLFKERMAALIANRKTHIVLNLAAIGFVDSSGLSAIVWCLKLIGGAGEMAIAEATGPVTGLMKLTRLDKVLRLFAREDDAIAALAR